MNPEEKQLLQKTFEMAEENNKMLRHIKRSNRLSMIFRISYWVIIIGISLGALYFIQPYIDSVMKAYGNIPKFY